MFIENQIYLCKFNHYCLFILHNDVLSHFILEFPILINTYIVLITIIIYIAITQIQKMEKENSSIESDYHVL
jgi:hypothetical protein